nr:integrase, catalytic region, zinc finger, CCHC-type, peptidase aspartic, catalytic [Tanacetum cinerariifolium]
NGDHPLTVVAQVSLAGTAPNAIPTLKDPNNETAKDLWDALEGKCVVLSMNNKIGKLQNQGDVNDALGYKKKAVVVTSDPLALVAEKTKVSKRKEKVKVQTESEGSDDEDIRNKKPEYVKSVEKKEDKKANEKKRDMSKVKYYNYKKEGHFAKDCKKAKVKDNNYYKTKMKSMQIWFSWLRWKNVLLDSDESSSSAEETIAEVAYYTFESERESEYENSEYYDNYTNYGLFVNDNDDQIFFHDAIESASENFIENHIDSQKDYDKSEVDHNDYKEKDHLVDKLIQKFNHMIAKLNTFEEQKYEFNEQMKVLNEKNADLLAQTKILQDQLKVKHVLIDRHTECQAQYAKLTEERNEYMIRYSALCDNDKQHRKMIDEQEILFDTMSRQLVEMNNNVLRLQEKILKKETKILELEGCVSNKDLEIKKCLERLNDYENKLHKIGQINQTIHMILPFKDNLYNGKKEIGLENPSYFEKAKDLRPSLYDEKAIGLGYNPMFLTHSNEALEIEKFKRARENRIEFAYDYRNLNASYVNEKQTSSLKPYVPTVILEKIIIDLEDEVVSLLEKEKANLELIESLKSKGFESSENAISESENQSENDCQVVEKGCDQVENSKVIAPGMFKLNFSQSVSPISVSKTSCASKNVENKTKKRHLDTFSSVRRPKHSSVIWKKKGSSKTFNIIDSGCSKHMTGNHALLTNFVEKFLGTVRFGNNNFAVIAGYGDVVIGSMTIKKVYYVEGLGNNLFSVGQFCDKCLEVAFRKSTCFVRTKDGVNLLTSDRSLNLYTIALNEVVSNSSTCLLAKASSSQSWLWHQRLSHLNFATINNPVKKILFKIMKYLTTNVETSNVEIPSNEEEVFHESSELFQKESSSSSLIDDVHQSLEEVVVPSSNTQSVSNNMVPNVDEVSTSHNVFNERLEDAYFDASLGHNLFSVGQFCDKVLEVAFRKSTCFVRNEDGVDLLTDDRSSNSYTIALNEVASNSSTCLLEKAYSSQSWLWHQCLSHLNFATTNNLVQYNLVQGLPKMKFEKDHLYSECE